MRHHLLLLVVCLPGFHALAQKMVPKAIIKLSAHLKDQKSTTNVSAYQLQEIPLSRSVNAFTLLGTPRTILSYQPDLDVVTFVRRGSPTDPGGPSNSPGRKVYYDYSSDGGATWQTARGKLYDNDDYAPRINGNATYGGQYPQGLVWNPAMNTNPAKAFMTGFTPVLNNKNGYYGGLAYSSSKLSNTAPAVRNLFDDSLPGRQISYALALNGAGNILHVENELSRSDSGMMDNTGRLIITKFSVDSATGAMASQIDYLHLPTGGLSQKPIVSDIKLSFGPDGQHGFLSMIGWLPDINLCPDFVFYPIIYKTSNGSTDWTGPMVPNITDASNFLRLRENIRGDYFIEPGSPPIKRVYSPTTKHGATVDIFNNLHLLINVGFFGLRNVIIHLPVEDPALIVQRMHTIDLMLDAGRNTFKYSVIGKPHSFRNDFNAFSGSWDHQLQASRNKHGDKIFFAYFDTDTANYRQQVRNLRDKNLHPDLFLAGLDVSPSGNFSAMRNRNVSHGTALDGKMFLANMPALVRETAQKISIPMTFARLGQTADDPVEHVFLSGIDVSNTEDSIFVHEPISYDTTLTSIKIVSSAGNLWHVFPNPASDYLEIVHPMKVASQSSFELLDILGLKVQTGLLQFTDSRARIQISGLQSGVYTLAITNDAHRVCKKVLIR